MFESLLTAIELIYNFDQEVWATVWTSLYTSCCAILLAALCGIPWGVWLGLAHFRGRRLMVALLNTLMALPTVVIGFLAALWLAPILNASLTGLLLTLGFLPLSPGTG